MKASGVSLQSPEWVQCFGGPHMLIPREVLPMWMGARPDQQSSRAVPFAAADTIADYFAAADVESPFGLLGVGLGVALVIGGDPPASTWLQSENFDGGVIVCPQDWEHELPPPRSAEELLACVTRISRTELEDSGIDLPLRTGQCMLMAASDWADKWNYKHIHVDVEPGRYRLFAGRFILGGHNVHLLGLQSLTQKAQTLSS